MSGYESIRDWAFDEYDFNDYDNFQDWLDAIESDFDLNGRGIPLRKIFNIQDFIDLENEFNLRKGIDEEELQREEEEEERRIEERREEIRKDIEEKVEIAKEKLKRQREEEEEAKREERVQTVAEIFSPVVEVVEKVSGFIKGLLGI